MSKCKPFYLNILLLNKDAVVASKVTEKAGGGLFGKAVVFAANKLVTDETVLQQLTDKLLEGLQKTIQEMGIEMHFELKYQQGALVVIRMSVVDVNTLQLVLSTKGSEFASNFASLLAIVDQLGMTDAVSSKIDEKISTAIGEGMRNKFSEAIPQKMAQQGVQVECVATAEEHEAEVFFELVQRLK